MTIKTKNFKRLKKLVIGLSTVASISMTSIISFAQDNSAETGIFIPTRSYYAKYISENASLDSDLVQYIWIKLFSEETNWNSSQPYYSPNYNSWANKYYSDYVGMDGIVHSSMNKQITYNPDFDAYLYQTLTSNDDFIINWINKCPGVFKEYCKSPQSHPIFSKALIKLTSGSNVNTNYLGHGKGASNNLFLRGASSTSTDKHQGNGSGPNWSVSDSEAVGYDIDILKVLGTNYYTLNKTQQQWVKTYYSWLINEYINNRTTSLPAQYPVLLDLISVSSDAFTCSLPQLFFDHCISNNNVKVGEFIVNSANLYAKTQSLYTGVDDISSNTDMSAIWDMSDGDCYYTNSSWSGYRAVAGQSPDNDYDWLCYQICFDNTTYWSKLKKLVAGNATTSKQMEDWLMRYNAKSPSNGTGGMADALSKAGQTHSSTINTATWSGCGKRCPEPVIASDGSIDHYRDVAFDCGTHTGKGSWSISKPLGVSKISFTIPTQGTNVDSTFSCRIYDAATRTTVYVAPETRKDKVIELQSKYIWSSTLVIEGMTYYRDGNQGHVGSGSCAGTHTGSTTINFTYANVSACVSNNHNYGWTYGFYDANGNKINDNDHTTTPAYCMASGVCASCGHRTEYKDSQLKVTTNGNSKIYTASFSHASVTNIGAKSHTVYKDNKTVSATMFSPTSNANYLSASSNLTNFGRTNSITKTYTGDGNSVQLETSTDGTVALKSGAIGKGAKSITVSAVGHDNIYRLVNPISGELNNSRQELIAKSGASTCTWDLSDYSDEELDGVYVIVEMYSRDENWGGHALGDVVTCESIVQFEYIKVVY